MYKIRKGRTFIDFGIVERPRYAQCAMATTRAAAGGNTNRNQSTTAPKRRPGRPRANREEERSPLGGFSAEVWNEAKRMIDEGAPIDTTDRDVLHAYKYLLRKNREALDEERRKMEAEQKELQKRKEAADASSARRAALPSFTTTRSVTGGNDGDRTPRHRSTPKDRKSVV